MVPFLDGPRADWLLHAAQMLLSPVLLQIVPSSYLSFVSLSAALVNEMLISDNAIKLDDLHESAHADLALRHVYYWPRRLHKTTLCKLSVLNSRIPT